MSRASYNGSGFVVWVEGKVADSTRVWNDYDLLGRLVRSSHWKPDSIRLRLDSLVYDASHNVTQRIDARGKISRFGYDAVGRMIWASNPNNDTSRTWYRGDGLPDSTRAPGQSASTRFVYDGTWKNNTTVTNAAGMVVASNTLDSWGRTTATQSRFAVRVSGATTYYQWRRVLTGFNSANQVDSSRAERTTSCSPCTTPPGWPSSTDSAQFSQVRYRYDRLGRTLARYNTQSESTVMTFDALGRLRTRTPPSPYHGYAPLDSFRYDLAGNLRYSWNRRGVQITQVYDSRNRDTMTTVPGVGVYRRVFAGPNDELTRIWIANYVDSIGAVNPNVSWVYSQSGRLLADTAQTNRVTRYTADFYGRDSVVTDTVGAWRLWYETNRGMLDTILTPFNDTLTYTFDALGQLNGPTLRGGGAALNRGVGFELLGTVYSLTNTVPLYNPGYYYTDNEPTLSAMARNWSQQEGSGGASHVYTDSVTYDGFERLNLFRSYRDGSVMSADTFTFDNSDNISRNSESRSYDPATDRMTSRDTNSYSYDQNSNLISWAIGSSGSFEYKYDGADRLVAVRFGVTLIARYAYDVLGRRIVRRVYNGGPNSAPTEFVRMIYRGGQVTAEADSLGALTLKYSWGLAPDDLVAIHRNDSTWYTVQDDLHSVRGLVQRNASASWKSYRRYGAYGENQDSAGTDPVPQRYRWIGRELDAETGFYYIRARYFDPASQRFTQEDPAGDFTSSNLFAYGGGNPLSGRDMNGLDMERDYSMRDWDLRVAIDPFGNGWGSWLQGGGSGFAGSMIGAWDLLTGSEKSQGDESYERYYEAFMNQLDLIGNASAAALTIQEYRLAYASLAFVGPVYDRDLSFNRQSIQTWMESGRIVVDRGGTVVEPEFFAITRFLGRNRTTFYRPSVFSISPTALPRLASRLVHEYAHVQGIGNEPRQATDWQACRLASLATNLRSRAEVCRGW